MIYTSPMSTTALKKKIVVDEHGQPENIGKDAQFMVSLLFGKIHHMTVDQPAQHIIDHSPKANYDQWHAVLHYFLP